MKFICITNCTTTFLPTAFSLGICMVLQSAICILWSIVFETQYNSIHVSFCHGRYSFCTPSNFLFSGILPERLLAVRKHAFLRWPNVMAGTSKLKSYYIYAKTTTTKLLIKSSGLPVRAAVVCFLIGGTSDSLFLSVLRTHLDFSMESSWRCHHQKNQLKSLKMLLVFTRLIPFAWKKKTLFANLQYRLPVSPRNLSTKISMPTWPLLTINDQHLMLD